MQWTGSGRAERRLRRGALRCLPFVLVLASACSTPATRPPPEPRPAAAAVFRIEVVDAETGRGVPAVEIRTNDGRSWFTDSAGVIALREPGLNKQNVYFRVDSFGYSYEGVEPGVVGTQLRVRPGGSVRLSLRRENVAERLYRVTGIEPYRDSLLAGDVPPFRPRPQRWLPAGSDSVLAVPHRGQLFWVWGDTWQLGQPHPIFRATAATSPLPERGGVDPERGIDLRYLADPYSLRAMVDDPHPVVWLSALRSVPEGASAATLFATYRKIEAPLTTVERGLAEYDDRARRFHLVAAYPADAPAVPGGHAFRYREGGVDYLQYDFDVRSRDDTEAVRDLGSYEAFTAARPGASLEEGPAALERDAAGRLVWGWKRNAARIPQETWQALEQSGAIAAPERPYRLIDVETGEPVLPHHGSIHWNAFRRRWIMIRGQQGGPSSPFGEIYYFEGDTPLGPWAYGRKIVTHSRRVTHPLRGESLETYSFYNPMQHPEFDQDGGREIFFEGTLSLLFADPPAPRIPGYDYNQLMYKLRLEDPRLFLPVPVYRDPGEPARLGTREHWIDGADPPRWPTRLPAEVVFFAPDRPRPGTQPVRAVPAEGGGPSRLVLDPEAPPEASLFHCVPGDEPPPATVPLYERIDGAGFRYGVEPSAGAAVLCHVWPAPVDFNASLGRALEASAEHAPGDPVPIRDGLAAKRGEAGAGELGVHLFGSIGGAQGVEEVEPQPLGLAPGVAIDQLPRGREASRTQ